MKAIALGTASLANGATQVTVILKSGTRITGVIQNEGSNDITLKTTALGTISILYEDILEISDQIDIPSTEYTDNPFYNRNYITETAFGLDPGQITYQNVLLGGNMMSIGISERFTLSGGLELFSVAADDLPSFWLSPKMTFSNSSGSVHFGLGANIVMVPENQSLVAAGSLYGVTTFGNRDHHLTIGFGYAFFDFETSELPSVQFGGVTRLSDKIFLSAETKIVIA